MDRTLKINVLGPTVRAPPTEGQAHPSSSPSSSLSTDNTKKEGDTKGLENVEATLSKEAGRITTFVTEGIAAHRAEEAEQQKKQADNGDADPPEAVHEIEDTILVRWRDEKLTEAVYKGLKRPRPTTGGPGEAMDVLLSAFITRSSAMVTEEIARQLAGRKNSSSPSTSGDTNLFTTLRRALKVNTAGITSPERLLERLTPAVAELVVDVASRKAQTASPTSQWKNPFGGAYSAMTKNSGNSSNGRKQDQEDNRRASGFGRMNVFARRKSSAASSSRRSSETDRGFPKRGRVRDHLVRLGIIAETDAMRAERRGATDVAAMEEQQKRMKDLAGRFWSKADDERSFIRQTFDSWRIDIGGTELKLDGRTITEAQWPVLEDVFEVSPHYRFTTLSMKKAYLKDEVLARLVPMLECNTKIKKVDWSKNDLTDEGMESVVELLAYNRAITELDLRDNAKVKAKGGHTLYEGVCQLAGNKTLRMLNGIPVRELQDRNDLRIVELSKRRLTLPETALLSRLLTHMPSTPHLTTLDLHDNLLDFRCLDVLLPALPQLPRLHTLDISGNKIGVEGAESIAYLLHHNKTLTHLRMADCDATKEGGTMRAIEAIGWVLACRNTTLLQIDLSGNQATERLVSRIQDSLHVNRSLSYDSHDEFERFITSKLPTVPDLPGDDPLAEAMADMPVFDEQWLRREKYTFRTFVIEPEVEVVSKKKRRMLMMMAETTQRSHTQPQQPQSTTQRSHTQPQQQQSQSQPPQQVATAGTAGMSARAAKALLLQQATMKRR